MPLAAALSAVPLPFTTPVTVVVRVKAGVAPPEDEPAKPFALDTDTAVTVPDAHGPLVVTNNPPVLACTQFPLVRLDDDTAVVDA